MHERIKGFYEDLYNTKVTNMINKTRNNYEHESDIPGIILREIEMVLKLMPKNRTPDPDHTTTYMIKARETIVLKII